MSQPILLPPATETMSSRPDLGAGQLDVPLSAMVPPEVRQAVRQAAAAQGTTIRTILLQALVVAGIVEVAEDQIIDRRSKAERKNYLR